MARRIFAQRLTGHSMARITRALNEAENPCPSAADPGRNPHRSGAAWTLSAVRSILANPRYTGRQVWNRQRTDKDLVDPANIALGHKAVQRWNLPDGRVISARPAHPALVSEADFIAAQDTSAAPPDPDRAKNACVREDRILAHLPALYLLLTGAQGTRGRTRRRTRKGADVRPAISTEEAIGYLRERRISLTWDSGAVTLRAGTTRAIKTVTGKAT